MNYSKSLKPNVVDVLQKRKECNPFYYALILFGCNYLKGDGHATYGVMPKDQVKCTPNKQCKQAVQNEKHSMLLREV